MEWKEIEVNAPLGECVNSFAFRERRRYRNAEV